MLSLYLTHSIISVYSIKINFAETRNNFFVRLQYLLNISLTTDAKEVKISLKYRKWTMCKTSFLICASKIPFLLHPLFVLVILFFIIFAGKRECKFSSNTILWQFPAMPFCNFPWKIYFIGSVYIQHPPCLSLSCAINNDAWRECAIKQQN